MHILLIHQAFVTLDEPGGTRHYELARHLVSKGHRVTVIASPISYLTGQSIFPREKPPPAFSQQAASTTSEQDGLQIIYVYVYPALHRSFVHRTLNFISFMMSSFWAGIKVRNVDLVWGTSPPIFQGLTSWLVARLKGVPFLFEIRDLWPAFAIQVGVLRQPLLIKASEWLESFLYRRADHVVVNSPGFIEHVKSRGAKEIQLVPNGSDTAMFSKETNIEQIKEAKGFGGKFVILYAGAHGVSNDLGVVISAADLLRDEANLLFILVGDGKEKNELMRMAREKNLENVLFMPPVAKSKMPEILAAADACLAILKPISLYATVYPNKVFDYMAAGKAVILAINGVIREVIENARAGIAVKPGDSHALAEAVRYLMEHAVERQAMGRNGRDYVVKNFDRFAIAEKFRNTVEDMVKVG